jgi:type IV pilus assembly protein PilV
MLMIDKYRVTPRNNGGFTLIEVLVALLVVTVGLIGMAGIQGAAVKYTKGAEGRSHAAQLNADILDRIRTSRAALPYGAYGSASSFQDVKCDRNFAVTQALQDQADIAIWRNQIACLLPGGQGQIEVGALDGSSGLYPVTVSVQWGESRIIGGANAYGYVSRSQL